MIYSTVLGKYEKILHEKYEISSTIRHKGERGRQREDGLRSFLKENLPSAYGVATGELIPSYGKQASPQCDIIIYDALRMPILGRSDAVQQIPIEAAYCIIESKSVLDSSAIKDTANKIEAIRALPKQEVKIKKGKQKAPFYFLFGYRLEASKEACVAFSKNSSKSKDVCVVALDTGFTFWIKKQPLWLNTSKASENVHETLAYFFVLLLENLRAAELGSPDFVKMLLDYSEEN